MSDILHMLDGKPRDQVTGHWQTRCGRHGLMDQGIFPRPKGCHNSIMIGEERVHIAMGEALVTCTKCRLKLVPTEKKVLRLLFDHGLAFVSWSRKFEWSYSRGRLDLILVEGSVDRLVREMLIYWGAGKLHIRSGGEEFAKKLPKIVKIKKKKKQ